MAQAKKTLLVLGSGFTSGGFTINYKNQSIKPPTDANFFQFDYVKSVYNKDAYPALNYFQRIHRSSSFEKTVSDFDLASKMTSSLSKVRILSLKPLYNQPALNKRINKKVKNNSFFRDNRRYQLDRVQEDGCLGPLASWEAMELLIQLFDINMNVKPEVISLINSLLNKSELKAVVTFNYDVALETIWNKSFSTKKLYYYDPKDETARDTGIPLFKMHGSINWISTFRPNRNPTWEYNIPSSVYSKPIKPIFVNGSYTIYPPDTKGVPDYIEEPTIILPDTIKQNITMDYQNDPKSELVRNIWQKVRFILNDIDYIFFIGFSFPETDRHARLLFNFANKIHPFEKIIVNTARYRSPAYKNFSQIFGENKFQRVDKGIKNLNNIINTIL